MDADEAEGAIRDALGLEETSEIATLLRRIRALPTDSKAQRLSAVLADLRAQGDAQVIIFTQYTDTVDFLRGELAERFGARMMCFSGRGGEVLAADGSWAGVSREGKQFRNGDAD